MAWPKSNGDTLPATDANDAPNQPSVELGFARFMSPDSTEQGTWSVQEDETNINNFFFTNTTAANADAVSFKVGLVAGTYSLIVIYAKSTDTAIIQVNLNGVQIASIDSYNGSTTRENVSRTNSISVSNGLVNLQIKANGKNASSSSYKVLIQGIAIVKTA